MRYLCDGCERLVEAGRYRVEGAALELSCPRCGEVSRVAAAEGASPAASADAGRPVVVPFAPRPTPPERAPSEPEPSPAAAPPVVPAALRCPKCATPKQGADACPKCGLVFALYQPAADIIPQSARREFARLLEEWGTPASERLLDAVGPEQVALLARLSRHHLADFPADARAQGILDALTQRSMVLASAAAQSQRLTGSESSAGSRTLLVVLGLVGLLGVALGILTLIHRG